MREGQQPMLSRPDEVRDVALSCEAIVPNITILPSFDKQKQLNAKNISGLYADENAVRVSRRVAGATYVLLDGYLALSPLLRRRRPRGHHVAGRHTGHGGGQRRVRGPEQRQVAVLVAGRHRRWDG